VRSWPVAPLIALALGSSGCAQPRTDAAARFSSEATGARERLVSPPSSMVALAADGAVTGSSGGIHFGGPRGRSALYLKFPSEWRARGAPLQAFIALSPRAGSPPAAAPVTLEAWRIDADWQPQTLQRWSDKPNLAPPYARARITPSPARVVRIDVTELLRFAAQNPERDFGIALIASGSQGPGASFDTGLDGGLAPRLELFLR